MVRTLRTILIVLLTLLLLFALGYRFLWTADNITALAEYFYEKGNFRFASSLYESALSAQPDNEAFALRLSELYLSQNNHTKAERTLVSAIRVKPSQALYLRLSALYVAQDKLYDALLMLDGIVDSSMRAQMDALRPAAPRFSPEAGTYNSYLSVSASAGGATVYYSDNAQFPSVARPMAGGVTLPAGKTTLKAIAVGENGLVSTLAEAEYEVVGVVEEVTFADEAFGAYIRELLYKSDSTAIYTDELWKITELNVPDTVKSYDDLRYFTNLTTLSLPRSNGDLSALSALKLLESLDLSGGLISRDSLKVIGSLTGLRVLNLSACGLSNIDALGALTALEQLDLSDNSIRSAEALRPCTKMQTLNLSHNALDSLAGLEKMSELTELNVSSNAIESVSPLFGCTKMQVLNLSANNISDLAALSAMTELVNLNANSNEVASVTPLSACMKIELLSLAHNALEDISALAYLTALTELDISHNAISALPQWSASLPLARLTATNNNISDISVLGGMPALQRVNLDYNAPLSDILCLVRCEKLLQVDVFGTAVRDVQALLELGIIVNYTPI